MTAFFRILVTFILALAVGAVVGWSWYAPKNQPPSLNRSVHPVVMARTDVEVEVDPQAPRGAGGAHAADTAAGAARAPAPTPGSTLGSKPAKPGAERPKGPGGNAADTDTPPVLVPAQTDRQGDDDVDLLPRGPNAWVLVDLASAETSRLTVRAGALPRDGAGAWRTFSRAKKVGVLRGKAVRVALLHLGFDRAGQPVVAHIRTGGDAPIEGMIPLQVQGRPVLLRRIEDHDTTPPAPSP